MNLNANRTSARVTGTRAGLSALCLVLGSSLPCRASAPSFDQLLSRARAQTAGGHRFAPAGNNAAETVLALYKLVSIATPRQLDALASLVDGEDLIQPQPRKEPATIASDPAADMTSMVATRRSDNLSLKPDAARIEASIASLPSKASPSTEIPDRRAASLFAQGESAENRGDTSAAGRFYSGAPQLGHAVAARQLGRLYDPTYVAKATIGGITNDPVAAEYRYERACTLGDARSTDLLHALIAR
jgi:hypothetical protein